MDYSAQADAALLALAGRGDQAAAAALVDRLGPKLMGFTLRMTGGARSEAEDIVQETFLRLWKKAGEWDADGPAELSTWLGRVAANLVIDRSRRQRRHAGIEEADEIPDTAPGPEAVLIASDQKNALARALDTLPDRQREAVVLRHIEGHSNPDIAAMMGCGVEAVESLVARGKRRLAELLRASKDET